MAFASLAVAIVARANDPSARAESAELRRQDEVPHALVLDGALGPATTPRARPAGTSIAVDAALRWRAPPFEAGLVVGTGGEVLGSYSGEYYGVLAGTSSRLGRVLELELLGEAGLHEVRGSNGLQLFGPSLSGTTALPYVGARLGADLRMGGRVKFVLGAWAVVRCDLEERHIVASGTDLGAFGGVSAALLARLGVEIGVGG